VAKAAGEGQRRHSLDEPIFAVDTIVAEDFDLEIVVGALQELTAQARRPAAADPHAFAP
jgi:hypothetical protein